MTIENELKEAASLLDKINAVASAPVGSFFESKRALESIRAELTAGKFREIFTSAFPGKQPSPASAAGGACGECGEKVIGGRCIVCTPAAVATARMMQTGSKLAARPAVTVAASTDKKTACPKCSAHRPTLSKDCPACGHKALSGMALAQAAAKRSLTK